MPAPLRIILDTDLNFPSDDFQAFLLLIASPGTSLLGCCASAGNTWSEEVVANIRKALRLVDKSEVPVLGGPPAARFHQQRADALRSLREENRTFAGAFEKSSVPRDWIIDPEPVPHDAPRFIVEQVLAHPGMVDLVCVGPLTNLAVALSIEPRLPELLRNVYIMGGHFGPGGHAAVPADFNAWFDPDAAKTVLESRLHILLLPLDTCRRHHADGHLIQSILLHDRGAARLFADDFAGMLRQHGRQMPLWDQLLALITLDPGIVDRASRGRVYVECQSSPGRGATTFLQDPSGNIELITGINHARLRERLAASLRDLESVPCEPPGWFASPMYQYMTQERLMRSPITVLRSRGYGTAEVTYATEIITTATGFARLAAPLTDLLCAAKARGEIWPPVHGFDADLAAGTAARPRPLVREALIEMEQVFFKRFMQTGAIAIVSDPGDLPFGFTSLSPMTEERRREMEHDYRVSLPSFAYITEFGLVEVGGRSRGAFQHMNKMLFEWCLGCHPETAEIPIFGAVLTTQGSCRSAIARLGYDWVGTHVIEDGPEAGRRLDLFRTMLRRP